MNILNANWDFIDQVIYINLDIRSDRNVRMQSIINTFGNKACRFGAIRDNIGLVGCVKSHIAVLETAISKKWKNILILEDDIEWCNFESAYASLRDLVTRPYDVIHLGPTDYNVNFTTCRLTSGNCTSSYIVNYHYMETLVDNFKKGLKLLLENPGNNSYALDQYWKKLQIKDAWYATIPSLFYQIEDFSNITNSTNSTKLDIVSSEITRRLIVGFTLNDEIDLVKTHLEIYKDVVDYFVISEAPWTHGLDPKKLYLTDAIDSGVFSEEEKSRIVKVVLDKNHLGGGFVNEYAHSWLAESSPWTNARVVGREVIIQGHLDHVWTIVDARYSNALFARSHLDGKVIDIYPFLSNGTAVKRWNWTKSDERCVAEGVQRNAIHKGLMELNDRVKLNRHDLIVILDADEFLDTEVLRSLKNNTWTKPSIDEFTIPDGRTFKITHGRWTEDRKDSEPLIVTGESADGLPFPWCPSYDRTYYGIKLNLRWHIFNHKLRKSIDWGTRHESAVLTTWNSYNKAKDHINTFGKRMPCHFRRQTDDYPQIGPCGWHLSWLSPFNKVLAYAEWSKEEGQTALAWMKHCVEHNLDPTPMKFGGFTSEDDKFECFNRGDRKLSEVEDVYMPEKLKKY